MSSLFESLQSIDQNLFVYINRVATHPILDTLMPFFRESTFWIPFYLFKEIKVVDAVSHEVLGVFEERVRKYNLNDFVVFMQKAGLQIIATFGDYQLNAYEASSSNRLILVAQKHSIS